MSEPTRDDVLAELLHDFQGIVQESVYAAERGRVFHVHDRAIGDARVALERAARGETVGEMIVARDQWGRYSAENVGTVAVKDGEAFRVLLVRAASAPEEGA